MFPFSQNDFIFCGFKSDYNQVQDNSIGLVEVFFAETEDLKSFLPEFRCFIDNQDKIKADRFSSKKDRDTFLLCHTFLRIILSKELKIEPTELTIIYDNYKKPWIKGNPIFFNLSHTNNAFAIAFTRNFSIGVDIEKLRIISFRSIIRRFFSENERLYILETPDLSLERFFLLWTRKEAFLKAIGIGIITELQMIEVLHHENFINSKMFENVIENKILCGHYIYSQKVLNYLLSIAIPQKAKISLNHIKRETLSEYL